MLYKLYLNYKQILDLFLFGRSVVFYSMTRWAAALQSPLSQGIGPRDLREYLLQSSCITGRLLTAEPQGKPQ